MSGTYKKDLFYGTFGEQLMDLLGRMAYEMYSVPGTFTGWKSRNR